MDALLLWLWLLVIFYVGIRAGKGATLEQFWVSGREAPLWLTVFCIVSSNVGAGALLAIASSTFTDGSGYGIVALVSVITGFLLVAFLSSKIKRFGDAYSSISMCEILGCRYGRSTHLLGAIVVFVVYLCIFAAQLLGFSYILTVSTALPLRGAIIFAGVSLVLYSSYAGVLGDLATDRIHFVLMSFFIGLLLFYGFIQYPLFSWTVDVPTRIWSPLTFGGPAFLIIGCGLGAIIPALSSENYVRVFGAYSQKIARKSFIWSAIIVVPFYICAIALGMLAHVKFASHIKIPDLTFLNMLAILLPRPLAIFGWAVLASVILSTSNTLLIVLGSIIWRDFLGRGIQKSGPEELKLSRKFTFTAGLLGLFVALIGRGLVELLLSGFYLLISLAPCLLAAFFWRKGTEKAATWSIALGATVTLVGLVFIPRQAFIPGLILATASFFAISFFTQHSPTEKPGLLINPLDVK